MNSLFDIEQKITSPSCPRSMLRRTPRRKLVFSSSDDETETSPQSISSVHLLQYEHHSIIQDEQSSKTMVTRTKLEHYGFQMYPRPLSLCSNKRQSTNENHQMKKFRLNDSHSDHLVNLFDKTLSTVTPNVLRERARRQPLPLCLSDNETNMPILTPTPSDDQFHLNKRCHDNEENSENIRSIKRSKVFDETNKENQIFTLNDSSNSKRSRRGINLIRSFTEPNEEQIKASVELGTNRDLIGDRSAAYLLPRCQSRKHPDLACISPETMVDVLQNVYSADIETLHIIDCRYPYEYDGGHIESAKNLYTRSQVFDEYFRQPLQLKDPKKRNIFIFHCEFSSERAPSLLRFFRSEDRSIHEKSYPELHYPEIYLLEGGYKAFYEYSKEFSFPRQYRPMIETNFQEDYRRYRAETKQCDKFRGSNERTGAGRRTRALTFRSCLSYSSQPTELFVGNSPQN